jgi:hypothetical protein
MRAKAYKLMTKKSTFFVLVGRCNSALAFFSTFYYALCDAWKHCMYNTWFLLSL